MPKTWWMLGEVTEVSGAPVAHGREADQTRHRASAAARVDTVRAHAYRPAQPSAAKTRKGRSVETDRFDHLTRAFATRLSRRTLAGALGLGALALPDLAEAKKKRKK